MQIHPDLTAALLAERWRDLHAQAKRRRTLSAHARTT
jgi:hypothetical protein